MRAAVADGVAAVREHGLGLRAYRHHDRLRREPAGLGRMRAQASRAIRGRRHEPADSHRRPVGVRNAARGHGLGLRSANAVTGRASVPGRPREIRGAPARRSRALDRGCCSRLTRGSRCRHRAGSDPRRDRRKGRRRHRSAFGDRRRRSWVRIGRRHRSRCRRSLRRHHSHCRTERGSRRVAGRGRRGRRSVRNLRGQEGCRVEVALVVGVEPDTEVDVGPVHLGVTARSDCPDAVAFGDCRALLNGDRPEVGERHVVSIGGRERDRLAAARHRPGKRHDSGGGSHDQRTHAAADVQPAVLPRGVRLSAIEGERLQDRTVDRPRPCARRGCGGERNCEHEQESSHGTSPL